MTSPDAFTAAYGDGLRGYLLVGGEGQLTAAYELGRRALAEGVTVLDLSDIHHDALIASIDGDDGARDVVAAGRDFLREALSAFEMARRGFDDARRQVVSAQRDAAMIRRLAELLADAPAADDPLWPDEVARLLAEQARHLCRAASSAVTLGDGHGAVVAVEHDPEAGGWATLVRHPALRDRVAGLREPVRLDGSDLAADPLMQALAAASPVARTLTGWMVVPMLGAGVRLGTIELFATGGRAFSGGDADVARHLALLATGALERRARARGEA
jgi:hypothetical protein